jgi:transcriptional regulator with XRE-family HTH domain
VIGTRLHRIRTARGMTQAELASPHYTHAYVSAIEAGRRKPSITAIEHFAERLGVDPEELSTGRTADREAQLRSRLQEAMIDLSAGNLTDADKASRSVAREAKALKLTQLQAKAEEIRGLHLERQDRVEEALGRYSLAEEILSDDPPTTRVDAVAGQARCFHSLGDVRYEIHLLESLLGEIEREGLQDPDALARLHSGLVFAYIDVGLFAKAADSAALLEEYEPRLADPLRIAQMHLNVARLHLTNGKVAEAERSLFRSEDAYGQLRLKTEMGYASLALGYLYSRQERLEEAYAKLESARSTFEETRDTKDLTRTLNELARVERLRGNLDEARTLLLRSIGLIGEGDAPILAWAYRELGRVSFADRSQAEKALRTSIELFERTEQTVELAVTYGALGDLLQEHGDDVGGCDAYRTGLSVLERST